MSREYNSKKCAFPDCKEEMVHPFLIIRSGYCLKHLKNKIKKKLKGIKK